MTTSAAASFASSPDSTERVSHLEMETVGCLSCGNDDFETLIFASDPITGIGGRFRVVRCRQCQLAFTNPRPTQGSIGLFYPDSYAPYKRSDKSGRLRTRWKTSLTKSILSTQYGYPRQSGSRFTNCLSLLARACYRRRRQRQSWIPFRQPGRLLDFGCGAGGFLQEMRAYGWSVEGLDMSETVARQVHDQTGIPVHVGTLPHPSLTPESYDAVTMWNALEHVHWPSEVVRAAADALRPGGILVIGVPNFASWSFEKFQQNWYALELPRHLVHFTPATLTSLLSQAGFRIQSVDQIGRVGWMRRSARSFAAGQGKPKWLGACRWKTVGKFIMAQTERMNRADFIRVIAEKQ